MLSAKATKTPATSATPKRALSASLAMQHSDYIDWHKYEKQTEAFNEWMTRPFNEERDGPPHQPNNSNLSKINFATSNLMAHVAVNRGWGNTPSFDWLLEPGWFHEVFVEYAEHLRDHRGNSSSYIAKQLNDLQHPIRWASLQEWEWGFASCWVATDLAAKLQSLARDYTYAARNEAGVKRARTSKHSLGLSDYKATVASLEASALQALKSKEARDVTSEERLLVAEALLLKMCSRGGRPIDMHQIWLAFDKPKAVEWALEDGQTALIGSQELGWELLVASSKGHFIHESLESSRLLLNAFFGKCFPHLMEEDLLFTPTMHGARISRSVDQDRFATSRHFAEYFEIVTKNHLGVALTPYGVRRMNASHLQATGASDEVQRSHGALMGTGIRNLQGTYDNRSSAEKSFLASEVHRHGFNPIYCPEKQNRVLPVVARGSGLELQIARVIRQHGDGTEHLALFGCSQGDFLELSTQLVRGETGNFPVAKLAIEPTSGRQLWRAKDQSIKAAGGYFERSGLDMNKFAVESLDAPQGLQPCDMVYVGAHVAIGEVLSIDDRGQAKVKLATELLMNEMTTSMRAFYRFDHDAKVVLLHENEVAFPIDLTFNPQQGYFQLLKSAALKTI